MSFIMPLDNINFAVWTLFVVISLTFHFQEAGTEFQRSPTSRYAYTEMGRFEDCGVDSFPIDTLETTTRIQCGLRCLRQAGCLSYEYNEVNQTCHLHSVGALLNLVPKFGFKYVDGEQPSTGAIHPCDNTPCNPGQICTEECAPHGYTCTCPEGKTGDNCDGLIPVDGGFSEWGNWTQCSENCIQSSYRNCTDPEPVGTGNPCYGPNTRQQQCGSCNVHPYIGCLGTALLNVWDPDLLYTGSDNSIDHCMNVCTAAGGMYKYAAMTRNKCTCIRSMEITADDFEEQYCGKSCPGDSSQICGHKYGNWWSIYEVIQEGNSYKGCFSGDIQDGVVVIDNVPMSTSLPPVETTTVVVETTEEPLQMTLPPTIDLCENVTICTNETVCTNATNCVNETICRNETVCQDPHCTVWVNGTLFGNSKLSGNGTASMNGTNSINGTDSANQTSADAEANSMMYGMLINGSCIIDADGTPCGVVDDSNQHNETGVMVNGTCVLDGTYCDITFQVGVNNTEIIKTGGILKGNCILDGTPCITDGGLPGEMFTGYCDEIPTPTTAEPEITAEQTTAEPYLGLYVSECIEGCLAQDFQYAGMWNGTTCTCFNTMEGLSNEPQASQSCNVLCPGGDDGGQYCGGESANTVFELDVLGRTYWTPSYNTDDPSDGDDVEQPSALPWVCSQPQDIHCTVADTGLDHDTTNNILNSACTLQNGLSCLANDQILQTVLVNTTYNFTDQRQVSTMQLVNTTELQCNTYENATDLTECNSTDSCGSPLITACIDGNITCVDQGMVNGTNVTICSNGTVESLQTVYVNESFVNYSWFMKNVSTVAVCEDYEVSLFCEREQDKLLGCHHTGDINDTITSSLSSLDIDNCGTYCSDNGYRLFAMRKTEGECACGNSIGANEVDGGLCSETCGSDNEPCGGSGLESVYIAECNLPFNVTKDQMDGDMYHYNEAKDDFKLWFEPLGSDPVIRLDNFTNIGLQWHMSIDLQQIRTLSKLVTTGMYITRMNVMTGATEFRLGTSLHKDSDVELVTDPSTHAAKVFTVADISAQTIHTLARYRQARYVHIFVDDYDNFPGLQLELYGCNI